MKPVARLIRSIAVVAAVFGGLATPAWAQNPAQAERPQDHATGSRDAQLVMVEYASFSCPHCAHFQSDVWPVIESEFIDTGLVRYVFRPMLTSPPQIAAIGLILADCAAEDRYFDSADLLFAEQSNIFETAQAQGDVRAVYDRIAGAVGLAPEDLTACLTGPAVDTKINAAIEQAQADGIAGTPSFIIGGKVLSTTMTPDGSIFTWGGSPLLINGGRVPGQLDGDTMRRIILHFLESPDEGTDSVY